jgi:hypothetical protein
VKISKEETPFVCLRSGLPSSDSTILNASSGLSVGVFYYVNSLNSSHVNLGYGLPHTVCFLHVAKCMTHNGAHPYSLLSSGYSRNFHREAKLPGRGPDNSPPSGAEVKNAGSYTSTPTCVFTAWYLVKYRYKWYLVKYRYKFTYLPTSRNGICALWKIRQLGFPSLNIYSTSRWRLWNMTTFTSWQTFLHLKGLKYFGYKRNPPSLPLSKHIRGVIKSTKLVTLLCRRCPSGTPSHGLSKTSQASGATSAWIIGSSETVTVIGEDTVR